MLEETLNDLSLLKVSLQYLCHRQKETVSMQPKSGGAGENGLHRCVGRLLKMLYQLSGFCDVCSSFQLLCPLF